MPKQSKITDADVARAYALARIEGGIPADHLDGKAKLRAIGVAILNGIIGHSGNVENGWLMPAGIELLPDEMRTRYREAISGRTAMRAG